MNRFENDEVAIDLPPGWTRWRERGGVARQVPDGEPLSTDNTGWDRFRDGNANYFAVYRLDLGIQYDDADDWWTLSLDSGTGTVVAKPHGHCTDTTDRSCRTGDGRLDMVGELVLKSGATYVFNFGNDRTENAPDDVYLRIFAHTRIKHPGP